MAQEINLVLELDKDLRLIFQAYTGKSLSEIGQKKLEIARPKDEILHSQFNCMNCTQTFQINLLYYEKYFDQFAKQFSEGLEPECIVVNELLEDNQTEIKQEIASEGTDKELHGYKANSGLNCKKRKVDASKNCLEDNGDTDIIKEPIPYDTHSVSKISDSKPPKRVKKEAFLENTTENSSCIKSPKNNIEKPYKCPNCNKRFVAKKNVKRHLLNSRCKLSEHDLIINKNKKNVELCLSYLPQGLSLPDLNNIQAPYYQAFEQADGSTAYVSMFAKFGDIRVTNFDINCMKCDLCDAPGHYISDLIGHRKHHHFFPYKQDECKGCKRMFKNSDEKRRHTYFCTEKDKILINFCEKCSYQGKDWKDYRQHLDSVHKNDWYKNKMPSSVSHEFLCELCSTVFKDKKHFNTHLLRHKDPKPFKCHHCDKAFVNRLAIWTHLVRVHFTAEAKYICNACVPPVLFCQAKPYMAHTRNIHLRAGTGPPKAPCPVCGKNLNKTFVKRHVQEAHGNPNQKPRFQCPENGCGKLFLQKHYMELHSRIHLPDELKRFRCQYCNQGFHTKQNKVEHERSHTGEKPYECSICQKAFARKATYLDHQREHTGKAYECSVCQKMYTDRGNFRHHMQQHEKHLGVRLTYTQEERRLMKMNLLSPQQALNTPKQETL